MRYFTFSLDCTEYPDLPDAIAFRITCDPVIGSDLDDGEVLVSGIDFSRTLSDFLDTVRLDDAERRMLFAAIVLESMGQPDFNVLAASALVGFEDLWREHCQQITSRLHAGDGRYTRDEDLRTATPWCIPYYSDEENRQGWLRLPTDEEYALLRQGDPFDYLHGSGSQRYWSRQSAQ